MQITLYNNAKARYCVVIEAKQLKRIKMKSSINTQANRNLILDTIENYGIRLSDFNEEQKIEIIKAYAAMLYDDGLIK